MIGKTISHYEVIEKLGEGGMGEVYLANDTSLDRKVALKILPERLQEIETARKRFLREAKSAAALDHPYICKIYQVGEVEDTSFIAMEYVQGHTLKERLKKGPLPLKEGIRTASEIAEALEKAHQEGIIHRDLKPSNIMLTPDGHVKVMDFGLAKQLETPEREAGEDLTGSLAMEGGSLGTLAYMSPEQLRGEILDTRSDLFSFGIMLYEMLTGTHPFRREMQAITAAAILVDELEPIAEHLPEAPEELQTLLENILNKDRELRLHPTSELRAGLADILKSEPLVRGARAGIAIIASAVIIAAATLLGDLKREPPFSTTPVVSQFTMTIGRLEWGAVWDPAGSRLAYTSLIPEQEETSELVTGSDIWICDSDGLNQKNLTADFDGRAINPTWSPDGSEIAFIGFDTSGEEGLYTVSADGGNPRFIQRTFAASEISWTDPNTLTVSMPGEGFKFDIYSIPLSDNERSCLTTGLPGDKYSGVLSQSNEYLLFESRDDLHQFICILNIASGEVDTLSINGSCPRWHMNGEYITYYSSDYDESLGSDIYGIWSVRFNPNKGRATGTPSKVIVPGDIADYSIAPDGEKIIVSMRKEYSEIWLIDIGRGPALNLGSRRELTAGHAARFVPGGNDIVYALSRDADTNIMKINTIDLVPVSLASSELDESSPIISPDGSWIIYSARHSPSRYYPRIMGVDGSNQRDLASDLETEYETIFVIDWSPVENTLAVEFRDTEGNSGFGIATVYPERGILGNIETLELNGSNPFWSPDGSSIVYESTDPDKLGFWVKSVNGSSEKRILPPGPYDCELMGWSNEPSVIYYTAFTGTYDELDSTWVIPVDAAGNKLGEARRWYEHEPGKSSYTADVTGNRLIQVSSIWDSDLFLLEFPEK